MATTYDVSSLISSALPELSSSSSRTSLQKKYTHGQTVEIKETATSDNKRQLRQFEKGLREVVPHSPGLVDSLIGQADFSGDLPDG